MNNSNYDHLALRDPSNKHYKKITGILLPQD
jgi:hypothetical protein